MQKIFTNHIPYLLGHHGHPGSHHPAMAAAVAAAGLHPDTDTDPRELEAFAERFKQRRIKLGKDISRYNNSANNSAPSPV